MKLKGQCSEKSTGELLIFLGRTNYFFFADLNKKSFCLLGEDAKHERF
jgi:hypothetical protein